MTDAKAGERDQGPAGAGPGPPLASADREVLHAIAELKRQRNAVILAHNYQLPEVQDIADFTGDSLELSRKAAAAEAGRHRLLRRPLHGRDCEDPLSHSNRPPARCPRRLPDGQHDHGGRASGVQGPAPGPAGGGLREHDRRGQGRERRLLHVANAVRIVESLDAEAVLFVPDKCLGAYVASRTGKRVILYPGFCPTHHRIMAADVIRAKRAHPEAVVVAHPECTMDVLQLADAIESTSGMLRYCAASDAREFIICTEQGILYRLGKDNPGKAFYSPATSTCART